MTANARDVILTVYREHDPLVPDSVADEIIAALTEQGYAIVRIDSADPPLTKSQRRIRSICQEG